MSAVYLSRMLTQNHSESRYRDSRAGVKNSQTLNKLGHLKIRYKAPTGGSSKLIKQSINKHSRSLDSANADTQFAVAVGGFGQRLSQESNYINNWQYSDSYEIASKTLARQPNSDKDGTRRQFMTLTELASTLDSKR